MLMVLRCCLWVVVSRCAMYNVVVPRFRRISSESLCIKSISGRMCGIYHTRHDRQQHSDTQDQTYGEKEEDRHTTQCTWTSNPHWIQTHHTHMARNRFCAQGLRGYPSPKRGTTTLYIAQLLTTTHRQHLKTINIYWTMEYNTHCQ